MKTATHDGKDKSLRQGTAASPQRALAVPQCAEMIWVLEAPGVGFFLGSRTLSLGPAGIALRRAVSQNSGEPARPASTPPKATRRPMKRHRGRRRRAERPRFLANTLRFPALGSLSKL